MKYFTKQQLKKLSPFEKHFFNIQNYLYKEHTSPKDNETVADIWDNYTGEKCQRTWGCGQCVYKLFKNAGKVYFESKKYYENKAETKRGQTKKTE